MLPWDDNGYCSVLLDILPWAGNEYCSVLLDTLRLNDNEYWLHQEENLDWPASVLAIDFRITKPVKTLIALATGRRQAHMDLIRPSDSETCWQTKTSSLANMLFDAAFWTKLVLLDAHPLSARRWIIAQHGLLLYGATKKSFDRKPRVQNKLARVVNNVWTRDNLCWVLWLPVRNMIYWWQIYGTLHLDPNKRVMRMPHSACKAHHELCARPVNICRKRRDLKARLPLADFQVRLRQTITITMTILRVCLLFIYLVYLSSIKIYN